MKFNFIVPHFKTAGGVLSFIEMASELSREGHSSNLLSVKGDAYKGAVPADARLKFGEANLKHPDRIPDADALFVFGNCDARTIFSIPESKGKKILFLLHLGFHDVAEEWDNVHEFGNKWAGVLCNNLWIEERCREMGVQRVRTVNKGIRKDLFYCRRNEVSAVGNLVKVGMLYHHFWWKGTGKGYQALEVVKHRLARENREFQAIFVSQVPEMSRLPYPPWAKVIEKVPIENMWKVYGECHLWLCPSFQEGQSRLVLESMACGTPVVCSPNSSLKGYEDCVLFPKYDDPFGLSDAIWTGLFDREIRARLFANGLKFVEAKTYSQVAKRITDALKEWQIGDASTLSAPAG